MIKVFERESKINFADSENVFVGYDTSQRCCERAGWFVSTDRHLESLKEVNEALRDFLFDTAFTPVVTNTADRDLAGNTVLFRLRRRDLTLPCAYLTLYNCHNGYYSHGFETSGAPEAWLKEGWL